LLRNTVIGKPLFIEDDTLFTVPITVHCQLNFG